MRKDSIVAANEREEDGVVTRTRHCYGERKQEKLKLGLIICCCHISTAKGAFYKLRQHETLMNTNGQRTD